MTERIGLAAEMDMSNFNKGISSYNAGLDKMHGQTQSFGSKVSSIFTSAAGVMTGLFAAQAVQKVISGVKEMVTAAADEQKGILQLGQAVKNTGANWDTASVAIEGYLKSELKRIALDDGPGRMAIQKLTEITGDYNKSLKLMPLVADLAAAKNMDLASAAMVVGRVSEGNTGMLARYGIMLTKSKDGAANAAGALAELSERFSGQAEILANTYPGAQKKFEIAIGNIKETVGGALLPVIEKASTQFANWAVDVLPAVEWAAQGVAKAVGWLTDNLSLAITKVSAFAAELVDAFTMGGGGEQGARNVLATLLGNVGLSEDQIQAAFDVINRVQDTLTSAIAIVKGLIDDLVDAFTMGGGGEQGIRNVLATILEKAGLTEAQVQSVFTFLNKVQDTITRAFDTLKTAIVRAIGDIQRGIPATDIIRTLLLNLGLGPQAANQIISIFNEVTGIFRREAERWISGIRQTITAIVAGDWGQVWEIWKTRFLEGLRDRVDVAVRIGEIVMGWVRAAVGVIGQKLDDVAVSLGPQFLTWLDKSLAWLGEQIQGLGERFSQIVTDILAWVFADRDAKSGGEAVKVGEQFWNLLKEAFGHFFKWAMEQGPGLSENLGEIIGSIIRLAIGLVWKVVSTLGKLIWDVLSGSITEATGPEQTKQGGDLIFNFLKGLLEGLTGVRWEEMAQIAMEMINGLVEGLEAQTDWLIGQIMAWIDRVIPGPIRRFLGISSPSKVLFEIGLDIVRGLAEGIDDGTIIVVERVAAVTRAIADIFGNLITMMRDLADAGGLTTPNVGLWITRLSAVIITAVEGIMGIYRSSENFKDALNEAYNIVAQFMRILDLLQVDLSKITVLPNLPNMTIWREQIVAVFAAIVTVSRSILAALTANDILALSALMEPIIKTFALISIDLTRMANASQLPNLAVWRTQMTTVFGTIRQILADIIAQPDLTPGRGGAIVDIVQRIISVFSLITVDLSRMANAAHLPDLTLWRFQMVAVFEAIRFVIADILAQPDLSASHRGAMVDIVQRIVGVFGLINIDLTRMSNAARLPDLTMWRTQMGAVFMAIRQVVADIISQPALVRLSSTEFVEVVQRIVAVFGMLAVDLSRLALIDMPDLTEWRAQMADVFLAIRYLVRDIMNQPALGLSSDAFIAAVQRIVLVFGMVAVDLSKMATAERLPNLTLWAEQLKNVFRAIGRVVAEIMIMVGSEAALESIARVVGYIMTIVGLIKPALEAFGGLAGYVDVGDLSQVMLDFGDRLGEVVQGIVLISGFFTDSVVMGAAVLFAQQAQIIVGVIKAGLEAIYGLAEYVDVGDLSQVMLDFGESLGEVVTGIVLISGFFTAKAAMEAAVLFAQQAQVIVGVVKSGIDAIYDLAEYTDVGDLSQVMLDFGDRLGEVIQGIVLISGFFADLDVMGAATLFAQYAQVIVGVIKSGIDAIYDLAEYTDVGDLSQVMLDFGESLGEVVQGIVWISGFFADQKVMKATVLFAQQAQAIIGLVKSALDAIADLAGYVLTEGIEASVAYFGVDLGILVYELYKALQNTGIAKIPAATLKFAAAIQAMIGVVKPALDAIADLAGYVLTEGIEASVAYFGVDLGILVYELYKALQNTGIAKIPPATLVFAQAVTTIVGVVKPAIDAIANLVNYETVGSLKASLENFSLRLGEVITAIVDLSKTYELTGVEAAAKFATAAGTIIGVVTTAITAIAALAEYKLLGPLGVKMQNVVDRLREILKKITSLSQETEFSEAALSGAVRFAGQVNTIAGGLKTTIDSIEIIANYQARGDITTKMNDLVFRISEMLNKIITLKNTYDPDGISASRDFLAAVLEVERNVLLAMEAVNNIATKPFTWGLDYNMTQFEGFIGRLVISLGRLFVGFDGMGLASATMLVQAQAAIGNIRTMLESLASITAALPGGTPFNELLGSYLQMAINVARQRLLGQENSMMCVFREAIVAFGDAGRDAAAAWGNGFDAGNLRIPQGAGGNQPVAPGGNKNVIVNLNINNNVANGMDVGLLNMQIKQVVSQAIGR